MNYYIMDANGVMLFRGTLEQCRNWANEHARQFRNYGMRVPVYRIFYDSATEPTEIIQ